MKRAEIDNPRRGSFMDVAYMCKDLAYMCKDLCS